MTLSPYRGTSSDEIAKKTMGLISKHPLKTAEIVKIVLRTWDDIFHSKIGKKQYVIGKDIFPKPQIMGFLLHELISVEFSMKYPNIWRPEHKASDKDLVYIPDSQYSIEIKTSSSKGKIYGNRSYAQATKKAKKDKSGYYLAVNFEDFAKSAVKRKGANIKRPNITLIRFGWLDHSDWMAQKAASGQQSRLDATVERAKFITLHPAGSKKGVLLFGS